MKERRDQERIRKDPCERTRKTCRKESEHRNKAEPDERPCCHLADTGQDRKRRKSHSLDRKTDHIHKRQRNVEHAVSDQEHRHTIDDLRLIRIHKEERNVLSAEKQDHKCDQRIKSEAKRS